MNIKLQIYILCRDRLDYSIEAIESVVKSADANTEVVISDNSVSDSIEKMCRQRFADIKYTRRIPPLLGHAHFKVILDEAKSEYLVLFHDDDIMEPNYVSTLLPYITANPTISAVACNAKIIDRNGKETGKFCIRNLKAPLFILESNQFIAPYLVGTIKSNGLAPFPGYMYRRKYICNSSINEKHGGKYSDVTFLLKILKMAEIVWHPESLMRYRNHGANDSSTESIPDRLSLIRYLITHEGLNRKSLSMSYFKFIYWLSWWRSNHKFISFFIPNGWRERVVFRFLAITSMKLSLYDSDFLKALLRKVAKLIKLRER